MSASAVAAVPEANSSMPAIGTFIHGGYFVGQIRVEGTLYGLVMAGAAGEVSGRWHSSAGKIEGVLSRRDGRENTIDMDAAGSKLAARVLALNINGFSDWYIPAVDELEIAYRNFKPSTTSNWPGHGVNKNSVPMGDAYTDDSPAQTTVTALVEDEADALVPAWYWSSTQYAAYPTNAWGQVFDFGTQDGYHESSSGRARAFRRFAI